jgi:lysophospholipase L1-like esterase
MRANDGFHLNVTGAQRLARAVQVQVQDALAAESGATTTAAPAG